MWPQTHSIQWPSALQRDPPLVQPCITGTVLQTCYQVQTVSNEDNNARMQQPRLPKRPRHGLPFCHESSCRHLIPGCWLAGGSYALSTVKKRQRQRKQEPMANHARLVVGVMPGTASLHTWAIQGHGRSQTSLSIGQFASNHGKTTYLICPQRKECLEADCHQWFTPLGHNMP